MVELMLNMNVCSILSHDVSKFFCFVSQLRFLIAVISCSLLAIFKGVVCERAEILGAFLAPLNSNVAPVFSKLVLHVVQFGPYN